MRMRQGDQVMYHFKVGIGHLFIDHSLHTYTCPTFGSCDVVFFPARLVNPMPFACCTVSVGLLFELGRLASRAL